MLVLRLLLPSLNRKSLFIAFCPAFLTFSRYTAVLMMRALASLMISFLSYSTTVWLLSAYSLYIETYTLQVTHSPKKTVAPLFTVYTCCCGIIGLLKSMKLLSFRTPRML